MFKIQLFSLVIAFSACSFASVQFTCAQSQSEAAVSDRKSQGELAHGAEVLPVSGQSKSSWLPDWKMPWSSPDKPVVSSYKKKEETTWDKFSSGSKKLWNKTVDVLDPYPEPKPPARNVEPKKPSFFSGWFQKKDSEDIESVNDFLRQERID